MQFLSFDFFAQHLRQTFSVSLGETSVEMTLMEAVRKPTRVLPGLRPDPFNLYFKSQSHVLLPQKLYTFKVPGDTKVDIFIVPVGRDRDGVVYEAIFN
jgi:hypothetical protein